MGKLKITVDLECGRCSTKIQKVLCCIQERCEFVIEKVEYEKDKVTVSGPFDANKLSCILWAKACRIIKNIEIVKEKEPEPKPEPKCKLVYSCPYPCPQPG
ncbi:protein PYRICULARIA ORYZAE RESISTANCE 21-like, partial [Miscanthus floridulus]|uniref:protein PYRICULARIA ORYZAE RESISTANCE 21-like n=1 Tax=Miscanthus floridulus TaxID=154761 RepID=UPI0034577408